jgi:hypothetical protein
MKYSYSCDKQTMASISKFISLRQSKVVRRIAREKVSFENSHLYSSSNQKGRDVIRTEHVSM